MLLLANEVTLLLRSGAININTHLHQIFKQWNSNSIDEFFFQATIEKTFN